MKLLLCILLFTSVVASAQQPIAATTEDGRKVMLYPDGTWRLVNPSSSPTPKRSSSQEGVTEHTYEFIQDFTLPLGAGLGVIRFKRGDRYHGRILADHAEVDVNGVSYSIPRSVLYAQPRD